MHRTQAAQPEQLPSSAQPVSCQLLRSTQANRIRGKNANPGNKAMFVFGEHARELITGEAALGLVRQESLWQGRQRLVRPSQSKSSFAWRGWSKPMG